MSQLTAVDYSYYRQLFPTTSPAYLSSTTVFYRSYTSTVITYTAITYFPTCGTFRRRLFRSRVLLRLLLRLLTPGTYTT
jgi:hypothetical protein